MDFLARLEPRVTIDELETASEAGYDTRNRGFNPVDYGSFQYATLYKAMCHIDVRVSMSSRTLATGMPQLRAGSEDTEKSLVQQGNIIETLIAHFPVRQSKYRGEHGQALTIQDRKELRDVICQVARATDLICQGCWGPDRISKAGVRIDTNTLPASVKEYVGWDTRNMAAVLVAVYFIHEQLRTLPAEAWTIEGPIGVPQDEPESVQG